MTDSVRISTTVPAPPAKVWAALTDPAIIKRYFFGATVTSDWTPGSPIRWSGEFDGKKFDDKGEITTVEPEKRLAMTHWSPMSGLPDTPDNYHNVTYDLEPADGGTKVTLTQQNLTGASPDKAKASWQPVLDGLKAVLSG